MSSTRFRNSLLCIALCTLGAARAADYTIQLPKLGDYEVWALADLTWETPPPGRRFSISEIKMPAGDNTKYLAVLDSKTGNVAIRATKSIEGRVWNVKPEDWRIASVEVAAFSRGTELSSGSISLEGKGYAQEAPTKAGKASFFAVPPGDVSIIVRYVSDGQIKRSKKNTFRLSIQRDEAIPKLSVTVADNVDAPATTPRSTGGSALANLITWIIGLGVALAALYAIARWANLRRDDVEERLRKLGVQIPGDAQTEAVSPQPLEAPPIVPEGHCPYCGKIFAECICQTGAATISEAPRLESSAATFGFDGSTHIIGREGDWTVADNSVSRKHAEVRQEGDRIFLRDVGSANGTYVNGARIAEEIELRDGDVLQVGNFRMTFRR
jgi:hypothetical protein